GGGFAPAARAGRARAGGPHQVRPAVHAPGTAGPDRRLDTDGRPPAAAADQQGRRRRAPHPAGRPARPVRGARLAGHPDQPRRQLVDSALHGRAYRGPDREGVRAARQRGPDGPDQGRSGPAGPARGGAARPRDRSCPRAQRRGPGRRLGRSGPRFLVPRRTMTALNPDIKENPADSPPRGAGIRRARSDRAAARAASARHWPLSRIIGVALLILLLFSVAAMVAGGLALLRLQDDRERVVGTLSPAALQVQRLDTALVDQETGVRGYALSRQEDFLAPSYQGMPEEGNAIRALQAVIGQLPPSAAADLKSVAAQARAWRAHYAQPTISQVSQTGKPAINSPDILAGKADFDALRARIDTLQARISAARTQAVAALDD